jgi:hypothetical protein
MRSMVAHAEQATTAGVAGRDSAKAIEPFVMGKQLVAKRTAASAAPLAGPGAGTAFLRRRGAGGSKDSGAKPGATAPYHALEGVLRTKNEGVLRTKKLPRRKDALGAAPLSSSGPRPSPRAHVGDKWFALAGGAAPARSEPQASRRAAPGGVGLRLDLSKVARAEHRGAGALSGREGAQGSVALGSPAGRRGGLTGAQTARTASARRATAAGESPPPSY